MLLGRAAVGRGHGVQEHRARSEVHDGGAGDAERVDVAAKQVGRRYRYAHVILPDDLAAGGVERINIVRFGHSDDHGASARPTLNVERLGIDVAADRALEVHVALERGSGGEGERWINLKSVARIVVVMFGDIDVGPGRANCKSGCQTQAQAHPPPWNKRVFHPALR